MLKSDVIRREFLKITAGTGAALGAESSADPNGRFQPWKLPRRRLTMKATLAIVLLLILCAGSGTLAEALCTGTSVHAFGAKGDGHTDDTAAIQSAIDAAFAAGAGSVVFNVARYFTTRSFVVPGGVILCGSIEGPFDDGSGVNPGVTTLRPRSWSPTRALRSSR